MTEKRPTNTEGISPEELDAQEASDLPNREALSTISPTPVTWTPDPANDIGDVFTADEIQKGPIAPAPPPLV